MFNRLDRFWIPLSLAASMLLAGCASGPPVADRAFANAAKIDEDATLTTFDPDLVASVKHDDFWGVEQKAEIDDEGRLVYRVSPPITNDRNYNRVQLNMHSAQPQSVFYDPITGFPIATRRPVYRVPRNAEGNVAPRRAQPTRRAPRPSAPRTQRSTGHEVEH